jgi:uncharacterized protein (TIGR01319 family)
MQSLAENPITLLVFDVGSTFTKAGAFELQGGKLSWLGRAQAPTTVEDIEIGLSNAAAAIAESLGRVRLSADRTYAASSAAGGLRMVAMGYMPRVTAKAAKEVAMSAGARVLEVMSYDDHPEQKLEMLREIRPDIILLAGGTDGGETDALVADAKIIAASKVKAAVVVAGNQAAQPAVEELLRQAGIQTVRVPNVMPTIHELKVKPAREAIHEHFIDQITKAKGLSKLLGRLSEKKVVPTPGAILMAAELMARGTKEEDGVGGLMVVDLGGATTDIHSVLPHLEELSLEEKGLVLTNEKQPAYRTVEGNLGLRVSARGIVEAVGEKAIMLRAGLEGEEWEKAVADYAARLEANPEHLAETETERKLDRVMAEVAVEVALKRHAGYIAEHFDPVMGVIPGTPIGRDLRQVEIVLAVGGVFAHSSEEDAKAIVAAALAKPGISLLPKNARIIVDTDYLTYAIGVLAQYQPTATLRFAKKHFGLE